MNDEKGVETPDSPDEIITIKALPSSINRTFILSENQNRSATSGGGDGLPKENENWHQNHFEQQLANVLVETENKIKAEANMMIFTLSSKMSNAVQVEKDLHAHEKSQLCQEINDLHQCVHSLESILEVRKNNMDTLVEKLQQQCNTTVCMKVFYSWKLFVENKKRERFLECMATKHYEKTLKQKAFSWWFAQLNRMWKNKMELRAHVDMLEVQRRIVDAYEARIRNLEDNLSEAGRKITTLQSKNKLHPESTNKDRRPTNFQNIRKEQVCQRTALTSEFGHLKKNSNLVFCTDCSGQSRVNEFGYHNCPASDCVTYFVHSTNGGDTSPEEPFPIPRAPHAPFSQPPHICHPNTTAENASILQPSKWIESHISQQPFSGDSRSSRPTSARSRQKKLE